MAQVWGAIKNLGGTMCKGKKVYARHRRQTKKMALHKLTTGELIIKIYKVYSNN